LSLSLLHCIFLCWVKVGNEGVSVFCIYSWALWPPGPPPSSPSETNNISRLVMFLSSIEEHLQHNFPKNCSLHLQGKTSKRWYPLTRLNVMTNYGDFKTFNGIHVLLLYKHIRGLRD
jgi:hypothetical protein